MDKEWLYQVRYWWSDQGAPESGGLFGAEYYGTELEAVMASNELERREKQMARLTEPSDAKLVIDIRRFEFAELIRKTEV